MTDDRRASAFFTVTGPMATIFPFAPILTVYGSMFPPVRPNANEAHAVDPAAASPREAASTAARALSLTQPYSRPASASGRRAHAKRVSYHPVSGSSVTPCSEEWTNQPLPA